MLYVQTPVHKTTSSHELLPVLPLAQKLRLTTPVARSPFVAPSRWLQWRRSVLVFMVELMQKLCGTTLYTVDKHTLLYELPPETRALLAWLVKHNLLETWRFGQMSPGLPPLHALYLRPAARQTPTGKAFTVTGANGIGSGESHAEAALPALGEFIERDASSVTWWENKSLYQSPYKAGSAMIDPQLFQCLTPAQYEAMPFLAGRVYTPGQSLEWVQALDMVTQKRADIPASFAYMLYTLEHPNEPFFYEVSSNGSAAYTDVQEASVRAIYELIERHEFILWWYHKRAVTRIDLQSLTELVPYAEQLQALKAYGIEVRLYDITGDLGIPTVSAFWIDARNDSASYFNVTASTNLSFDVAIKNVLQDVLRFAHYSPYGSDKNLTKEQASDMTWLQEQARSLEKRMELWSHQEMAVHLKWLDDVPVVSYETAVATHVHSVNPPTSDQRYEHIRTWARNHGLRIYVTDVTNATASYAGLHVVRAVSPDLVQIFFSEGLAPLAQRLFTHTTKGEAVELNPVPHPFI